MPHIFDVPKYCCQCSVSRYEIYNCRVASHTKYKGEKEWPTSHAPRSPLTIPTIATDRIADMREREKKPAYSAIRAAVTLSSSRAAIQPFHRPVKCHASHYILNLTTRSWRSCLALQLPASVGYKSTARRRIKGVRSQDERWSPSVAGNSDQKERSQQC